MNPLMAHFRRPALYIKLPSGGRFYDDTIIKPSENGELPVYPMTNADDMISKTPDAVFNGHAVAEIIKSCVPNILDPWKINSIDLDAIIIAIRVASNGESMDIDTICPKCNESSRYEVDLMTIMNERTDVDYNKTLKVRELELKFRPLTYSETNNNSMQQYELQKIMSQLTDVPDESKQEIIKEAIKKINDLTVNIISSTIEWIKTPETTVTDKKFIFEFLTNCDKKTNTAIKDFSIDLKSKNAIKPLKFKCVHCTHEYQQELILNITDFFE